MSNMKTWWVHVRTDGGGTMVATVMAPDSWQAIQIAKNLYGKNLISDHASLVNN